MCSPWPRKVATEVTSFFEGAAASIRLGAAAATSEEEVDRDSIPTPTKEVEERHRDRSRGRGNRCNRNSRLRDSLCMESIAGCTHFARVKKKCYPSVIVNQLMGVWG